MIFRLFVIVLIFISQPGWSVGDYYFYDHIYVPHVRSVKFHVQGLFASYPILELNSSGKLTLTFDDLEGGGKYYMYRILHCNSNWEPSELEYYEYIDGYEEEEIRDYAYSVNTLTDYTNYWLTLPNENTNWTKSGNYLLIIYEDNANQTVVITRRFMVVESRVAVIADVVRTADVSKQNTHQEIDFEVDVENLGVTNPKTEISATILQNGRWDNAIQGLPSRYERRERLIYDYQDQIIFPAGKDFRFADLRSVKYRSYNVREIQQYDNVISVLMEKQKPRVYSNFFEQEDLNGQFIIQSSDNFERGERRTYQEVEFADSTYILEIVESVSNQDQTEADYLEVTFSLEMPESHPVVYMFGAITDWQLDGQYRMEYDNRIDAYIGTFLLKQGYYDYYFVTDDGTGHADLWTIEGSWYESDNNYTILIYFRPFGGRYEQLVAAHTIEGGY